MLQFITGFILILYCLATDPDKTLLDEEVNPKILNAHMARQEKKQLLNEHLKVIILIGVISVIIMAIIVVGFIIIKYLRIKRQNTPQTSEQREPLNRSKTTRR
jgi:hypothetical protein